MLILLDWETFSLHLIHIVQRKIIIFRKAHLFLLKHIYLVVEISNHA